MTTLMFFNGKAIGFNNYQKTARNGRRYTTQKGKDFQALMHNRLNYYRKSLMDIKAKCDPNYYGYEINVNLYLKQFYTKKGDLHKRCLDVDAPVKIIIDQVFTYLGVDDCYLLKQSSIKIPSDRDCFTVELSTCPYPEQFELLSQSSFDTLSLWQEDVGD